MFLLLSSSAILRTLLAVAYCSGLLLIAGALMGDSASPILDLLGDFGFLLAIPVNGGFLSPGYHVSVLVHVASLLH